ncbi:MAG: hypothetical protein M1823_002927 [Watsoniomyces obsoletus]|nr:MAG: hypothetical protein M1823_002927 [Watsoniomyces obsoletus]
MEILAGLPKVHNEDMVVLSEDQVRLCVFLKNGLGRPWQWKASPLEKTMAAIQTLLKDFPPPPPKAKDIRHTNFEALKEKYGEKNCGLYHFALWHEQGRAHTKQSKESEGKGGVVSKDVGGGYKHNFVTTFYKATAPLAQTLGLLFDGLDPHGFTRYRNNFNHLAVHTGLSSLHFSHRDCFLGRVLLHNLVAEPHRDALDTRGGWVAICCFGDFTGGHFVVEDLKIRLQFEPGDVFLGVQKQADHAGWSLLFFCQLLFPERPDLKPAVLVLELVPEDLQL